jgi:predicted acyl esterase
MSEHYILPNVEPMVLAEHHPTITAIFPQSSSLQAVTSVGWAISGANERKLTGTSDFNSISAQQHTPATLSRQSKFGAAT